MNEEKITDELHTQDTEAPISVQVFDEEQDYDEEYYAANLNRKRQFISAQSEENTDSTVKAEKRTVFSVIADFIYHHKFISVVLGVVLVVMAAVGIYNLCQQPCDYNIGIYTCGGEFTDAEIEHVKKLFYTYGKDRDGDGKITVRIETYHPIGDNVVISFIHDQILRRDIYGDAKHGDRVNDIIITDEAVRDMIYREFGVLVFDEICSDGVWAEAKRSELLGEDGSEGESLGFMVFALNYYDSDPMEAKADYEDAREVFAAITENHPEMFYVSADG